MHLTQEVVDHILELSDEGIPQRKIARVIGCSRGTVIKAISHPDCIQRKKRNKEPHLVEVPKYMCPKCHHNIVIAPCLICTAKKYKEEQAV